MKPNCLFIAIGALVVLVSPVCAHTTTAGTGPTERRIADVIDIAPWGRLGDDGQPAGVYVNIFKRLSERSGCVLEPRLTPIPRAVMEVSRGVASATIMLDRADLNKNAVELGEVTALRIEVWLPAGSRLASVEDLAGKTVGVLRGPSYHEGFDKDTRIRKQSITNPRQQLEMLLKGRLDAVVGVRENFLVAAEQMRVSPNTFAAPIDLGTRAVKLWVAPTMRDSPCANQLAQSLKDMRRAGEIDRFFAR